MLTSFFCTLIYTAVLLGWVCDIILSESLCDKHWSIVDVSGVCFFQYILNVRLDFRIGSLLSVFKQDHDYFQPIKDGEGF